MVSKGSNATDFKPPDLLIKDYIFKPIEAEEMKINPILGVEKIHNIYTIDWNGLKQATVDEWTSVC